MLHLLQYTNWEKRGRKWLFLVTILSRKYLDELKIWKNIISLNIPTLGLDVQMEIFE
jgi:hypothetical protein